MNVSETVEETSKFEIIRVEWQENEDRASIEKRF